MSEKYTIEIKKRPWYAWLLWALWFFVEIFILQNAIASLQSLYAIAKTAVFVPKTILTTDLSADGGFFSMNYEQ